MRVDQYREGVARKLRALVGVEDLQSAVARECVLNGLDAEVSRERDRGALSQHAAAPRSFLYTDGLWSRPSRRLRGDET